MKLEDFVGKEVQIYPGDGVSKWGIIEEISDKGFLFRITKVSRISNSEEIEVGEILFISHSKVLTFKSI